MNLRTEPVGDRSAWIGEDLARRQAEWIYRLTEAEAAELVAAATRVRGRPLTSLGRKDFDLPTLDRSLDRIAKEVDEGLGLQLVRGFPSADVGDDVSAAALWAVSTRLGAVISQNAHGDMVGHVRDLGRKLGEKDVRGYDTNSELRFHNDECDIIALMCLRSAKTGGLSSIVSSASVFNRLLETKPDTLAKLFEGYTFSLMGEHRPGVGPVSDHLIPIFSWHAERMSCRYTINTVLQASKYTGVELTEQERATLFAPLEAARTPGLCINFELEPGDIQLANNLAVLHQRTAYEDHEAPEKKRHLLRLWLASHHPRALDPRFEERFNGGWSFRRGIPITRARSAA